MGRVDPLLKEQRIWQTQQTFCFWKNLITQWHLFMEANRNTTQSHTAEPARGGSFGWEALPRRLLRAGSWRGEEGKADCPRRGRRL